MTTKKILAIISFILLVLTGCNDNDTVEPQVEDDAGFPGEVRQIFSQNCATSGCHAGENPANGLSLETYSDLMRGSSARPLSSGGTYSGEVVVPFNSERSLLYQMINGNTPVRMPFNRESLSNDQIKAVKNWIDNSARDNNGSVPFSNPSYRVYVCNQKADAISVIDGDEKVVSRIYETNFSDVNDSPHMAEVFGDYLYVTYITAGLFVKFDKRTGELIDQVDQLQFPGMIAINSDGTKAFVSLSSSAPGAYNVIYSIDLNSMKVMNEILLPVSGIPHGIALTSDSSKLFVANLTANRISVVDAINDVWSEDIVLDQNENHEPMQVSLSPDDKYLYISGRASGKLLVLDTERLEVVKEIPVGMMPMHIAVSSDGSKIYVPSMMTNSVNLVEFDGTDWMKTIEITHPAFQQLHGCVLSPSGDYLFVSSRNTSGNFEPAYPVNGEAGIGNVGIINTVTNSVEKLIEIESYGAGMAVD